jgi:uncharacterized repeat protein (TIGR03803 family)
MYRARTAFAGIFVFGLLPAVQPASAQATFSVLHNFGASGDGTYPDAPLVMGSDGVLYGVTVEGGTGVCPGVTGCGIVFSLTPPASGAGPWTESVLYNFVGGSSDGALPSGLSMGSDGVLYGTTGYGGSGSCSDPYLGLTGCGTIFSLAPPVSPGGPWTETLLYGFAGGTSDGAMPRAAAIMGAGGVLYGTTEYGGPCASGIPAFSGCGTVFSLTPPPGGAAAEGAWTEAVLHEFTGSPTDGANPLAGVALAGGVLYGTTYFGGNSNCTFGCGTVFELAPPSTPGGGWTEKVLHDFNDSGDASRPWAGVLVVTGTHGTVLYGSTTYGGTNDYDSGAVYSMASSAGGPWNEKVLYSFAGNNPGPIGGVILGKSGLLYGTTEALGKDSDGTVFQLRPPAEGSGGEWTQTILHQFAYGGGTEPQTTLTLGGDGILYGTAYFGGARGKGTAFSLAP